MTLRKYIISLLLGGFLVTALPCVVEAYSFNLNAVTIYKQARSRNHAYFQLLRRYPRAIDITDNSGNTAYCLAMSVNDRATMDFLAGQGANVRHHCVGTLYRQARVSSRTVVANKPRTPEVQRSPRFKKRGFFDKDENVWYTIGGIAVVGGVIAALASSSGGSKSSGGGSSYDIYPPSDNPEVNTLRSKEYRNTNSLGGIKAAEAYSVMYNQTEDGKWVSKQSGSEEPLAVINVGVLDSGIYANDDLEGKIVKTYDYNKYNSAKDVWGKIDTKTETYVFYDKGKYYLIQVTDNNGKIKARYYSDSSGHALGFDESDIPTVTKKFGVNFDDMVLINDGQTGSPGMNRDEVDEAETESEWLSAWYGLANELNHGTHVSGIIAGNKNDKGGHGVAFENARIYMASWDLEQDVDAPVKAMVDDGATVLNHSWGTSAKVHDADDAEIMRTKNRDILEAYAYAANRGVAWVQATGNEGMRNSSMQSGIGNLDLSDFGYAGAGEHEAPFVAVTSLDLSTASKNAPSGKLASYSNWCGSAKGYCIAAPGTKVESTAAVKSGTMYMDGTSMATPTVSGSIALLNGYYPWLSAQNVAWLLLETANNEGEYANSNKYGRGALDLEAAVKTPIGDLGLPSGSSFDSLSSVRNNKVALSGVMQQKLGEAMPKNVVAFDELNRPFAYNTSNIVSKTHGSSAALRNEVSRAAVMSGAPKVIKDEKTGFQFATTEAMNRSGKANLATADVAYETEEGATRFYYAENSKYLNSDDVLKPAMNPYFAMNDAYGAEGLMRINDVSKLKFSVQTGENGLYDRDYERDRQSFDERAYAFGAEYSFNLTDYLELSALGGMLHEEEAMLGMNGRGGFGMSDGTTYYGGLKAALSLTDNFSLLAAYYRGYTQGRESAMLTLSGIETESFMLGGEYTFDKKNKMGLSLSSPLSVVKGKASFAYATGRDKYSDTIYMEKMTTDLKPATREYDLGLYYQGQPQDDLGLMGKVETRFNADGEKGVTDYLGVVGVQYNLPH